MSLFLSPGHSHSGGGVGGGDKERERGITREVAQTFLKRKKISTLSYGGHISSILITVDQQRGA